MDQEPATEQRPAERAHFPSLPLADLVFVRRVFIIVAIGALVAAVWTLTDILHVSRKAEAQAHRNQRAASRILMRKLGPGGNT